VNLCDGVGRPRGSRQWTSSRPPSGITRGLDSDAGGSSESSLSSSTSTNNTAAVTSVRRFTGSFPGEPAVTRSLLGFLLPLVPQQNLWGISGTGFYAPDAIPDTNIILLTVPRKLTENQRADPKQWSCLILSSSITRLMVEGALLSLLRLCNASNHVHPGV